jgi:hypothetical protein
MSPVGTLQNVETTIRVMMRTLKYMYDLLALCQGPLSASSQELDGSRCFFFPGTLIDREGSKH